MNLRRLYYQTFPLLVLLNALVARADYSNTVMSLKPVAYWPLNERPGTDIALNHETNALGLELRYCGSVALGVAGGIVGDTNTAAAFDGATAYLMAPFHPALSLAGPFSIEGWFKPATAAAGCVCACGVFGGRRSGWVLYYEPFHGWNFRVHNRNSPAPSLSIEGGDTAVGVWHHVAAVFNGTNGWLYVDGSLVAGPTVATDFTPNQEGAFTIGTRSDNSFAFNGAVDEVALYTNALASSVVQEHYQNGTNPTPSSPYAAVIRAQYPLLYCRLDEASFASTTAMMSSSASAVDSEAAKAGSPTQKPTVAFNYGSLGAAVNGTYVLNARPGQPGPPFRGFGGASFACGFDSKFTGYVDCTTNAGLNITGPMTAVAWVKASPGGTRFQTFLGRSDHSWRASVDWGGAMRWADGKNNADASGAMRVNDGMWHFFAGVYDGDRNYVYVDGKLDVVAGANSPIGGSDGKTLIGSVGDYPSDRQFEGSVAQVALYTNALSEADILRIYQSAEPSPAKRE